MLGGGGHRSATLIAPSGVSARYLNPDLGLGRVGVFEKRPKVCMTVQSPGRPPELHSRCPEGPANLPTPALPDAVANRALTPLLENVLLVAKESVELHSDLCTNTIVEGIRLTESV